MTNASQETSSHLPGAVRRRILIVRLGAFGDILLTIPAQQFLGRIDPSCEIHWLAEPPWVPLLRCVSGIHRVWTADTKGWRRGIRQARGIRKLLRELRSQDFDEAIDFQGLLKSAALARLSGARRVRGFSRAELREKAASWFYTDRIETERGRHQLLHHLDLLSPPSYRGPVSARIPLVLPGGLEDALNAQLEERSSERPILLNLGGGWETKRWAPERFGALATQIEGRLGVPTLFTIGPGEEELGERAVAAARCTPRKCLRIGLLELAALCRRSRLMVAGDTGPLHLAVAMGTPTVAILGPALPWRTGPFDSADETVLHSTPCPHPYSRTCRDHFCMDIPVEAVYEAVERRLAR